MNSQQKNAGEMHDSHESREVLKLLENNFILGDGDIQLFEKIGQRCNQLIGEIAEHSTHVLLGSTTLWSDATHALLPIRSIEALDLLKQDISNCKGTTVGTFFSHDFVQNAFERGHGTNSLKELYLYNSDPVEWSLSGGETVPRTLKEFAKDLLGTEDDILASRLVRYLFSVLGGFIGDSSVVPQLVCRDENGHCLQIVSTCDAYLPLPIAEDTQWISHIPVEGQSDEFRQEFTLSDYESKIVQELHVAESISSLQKEVARVIIEIKSLGLTTREYGRIVDLLNQELDRRFSFAKIELEGWPGWLNRENGEFEEFTDPWPQVHPAIDVATFELLIEANRTVLCSKSSEDACSRYFRLGLIGRLNWMLEKFQDALYFFVASHQYLWSIARNLFESSDTELQAFLEDQGISKSQVLAQLKALEFLTAVIQALAEHQLSQGEMSYQAAQLVRLITERLQESDDDSRYSFHEGTIETLLQYYPLWSESLELQLIRIADRSLPVDKISSLNALALYWFACAPNMDNQDNQIEVDPELRVSKFYGVIHEIYHHHDLISRNHAYLIKEMMYSFDNYVQSQDELPDYQVMSLVCCNKEFLLKGPPRPGGHIGMLNYFELFLDPSEYPE